MNLYSQALRSVALPWVSMLTESDFWRIYKSFNRSPEHTVYAPSPTQTSQKLKALMTHAYQNVPFYRERMSGLGLTPGAFEKPEDLRQLPPTTKADISANFPDRITASAQAYKPWRYVSTSGTTGRLTVIQDFRKRDYVRAAMLLALNSATGYQLGLKHLEIPPDICTNVCGASDTTEPNVFDYFLENLKGRRLKDAEVISDLRGMVERQLIYRKVQLPSFGGEGFTQKPDALDDYLKQIDDYQPFTVKALPTYLYLLALHLLENNLKPPRIRGAIVPMGGSMTPYMKQVIESAFQCPVRDLYGCAELGDIAAQRGDSLSLWPFANLFYVEVVRGGRPAADGEVGRVLITDLWNYAMPMIRYDIGDVAKVRYEKTDDGQPAMCLEIHGRVQDCLVAEDGTILTSDVVTDVLLAQPGVLGFQMEARAENELYLQVVPRRTEPPNLDAINEVVLGLVGKQYRIWSRLVPTIPPEPGGKYRFVKNMSKTAMSREL